jgi:multiple sugar transport system permease protein
MSIHLFSASRHSTADGSTPRSPWRFIGTLGFNLFAWLILALYLLPVASMCVTALMSTDQLMDRNAPWYPARIRMFVYQGNTYPLFHVPMATGTRTLALVHPLPTHSQFLDPADPSAALIDWQGDHTTLKNVYELNLVWSNFAVMARSLRFGRMLASTSLLMLIGGVGVLVSSTLVAYGFARFPLPGGDLLFYLLIATILIPDKVTMIPTFFFYVIDLHWQGTIYPLVMHLFFGSAVYIFLLRQNFRTLPVELEESAMLDGAGPLRRLVSIVLPQSWPVVVTVTLLHFFYTWNETRLASLYLSTNSTFIPISIGVQNYQSRVPIQNVVNASSLVAMALPVIILFLSQRIFMRGIIITGMEKKS